MAEEEQVEVAETDNTEAFNEIREAQRRADKRAKEADAARRKSDEELASLRAEIRQNDLSAALKVLGAPDGVARVYPSDAPVDAESVSKFVKDLGVQLTPAANADAWDRVERMQQDVQPAGAQQSELDKLVAEGNSALAELISNPFDPNKRGEENKARDFLRRANSLQDELDPAILTGREEPLVKPEGFGGRIDPPAFARTAKAFHGR